MKFIIFLIMVCIVSFNSTIEAGVDSKSYADIQEERSVNVRHDSGVERKSFMRLHQDERTGVKHYKRGNYKKAYAKLSVSAQWGLKQAQYLLGIMYLKGQYVDQSIAVGMGWVGVAQEVGIKEWSATYNEVYQMLTLQQKTIVDDKVATYIKLYGMDTQKIDCEKKVELGRRKPEVYCEKTAETVTTLYELENVPVDTETEEASDK